MILTPVIWDTTFLQNATWEFYSRFCINSLATQYEPATGLFSCGQPHHRLEGESVVLGSLANSSAASAAESLPVGFASNVIYYVIEDGLTATTFKLSAELGGDPVVSVTAGNGSMVSAVPLDLQGALIDCDITGEVSNQILGTFVPTTIADNRGLVRFRREAELTVATEPGRYRYDCSITFSDGTRVYPQKGVITVEATVSRNDEEPPAV
jgi:hypothetical protein